MFNVPLMSTYLLIPVLTVALSAKNVTQALKSAFYVETTLFYRMVYANVKTAFSWMDILALSVANPVLLVRVLKNV